MYFRYFVIISPWKRVWPFIWTNLNPLHPRMLCAKFGWNWPSGSGEEDENVKSLRWRRRQRRQRATTDNGQILIRTAHLSLRLRWAKKKRETQIKSELVFVLWTFAKYTLNVSNKVYHLFSGLNVKSCL